MVNELRLVNLFFTKDPVLRCKDHVGLAQCFNVLGITPFELLHCFPVNILVAVGTGFDFSQFARRYGVTDPKHKLAILVVRNLSCIHPETTDRYGPVTGTEGVCRILITWTHMEGTLWYVYHARRLR